MDIILLQAYKNVQTFKGTKTHKLCGKESLER